MNIEKQFGELSQFKKRDVELFRSSDLNETAIYFTEVEYENRKDAKAFFELLRFELNGGEQQIYIRFPNTNYFVEMVGGGFGSAHGDMMQSLGKNVWDDQDKSFSIYSHGQNLILILGAMDGIPKFNFMTKVSEYDKGNPYNHPHPNEAFVNFGEIEKALAMQYVKIPQSIRKIAYLYKTKDISPKFFVVDFPAYSFKYRTHRFRVIENNEEVKEYVVKNFARYRDGGTTIITVLDESGNEHKFFSPTSLPTKTLVEKWDDIELIEVTSDEKQKIVEFLKLELVLEDEV